MTKLRSIIALLALCFSVNSNAIIIGTATPGTGNCFPFGCPDWTPEYQQVYDASLFTEAFDISSLTFYNTVFDSGSYDAADGIYTISFSTTSAAVDGLSPTFSNNVGADSTMVYVGELSGVGSFGGSMDIILDSLFSYDPMLGNLLMSVTALDVSASDPLFFDRTAENAGATSRGFAAGVLSPYGLVTGFNEAAVVSAPASLLLIAMGIFGLRRVRRN